MEYELEHSDTLDDVLDEFLSHSAKGTVWKDHKYIKKENGRYYYADDKKISKTSSDELMDEVDAIQQQMAFCDQKAKEYDELAKSNPDEAAEYKAQAKKYRDEIERLNGEREQIAKGIKKKDKHDEIVNDFRNEPMLDTLNKYKKNIYLGNPKLVFKHSEDIVDDFLMHYGKGHDDNPPGRGSGRYAYGSGERPHQHDENEDAGEKKKKGLFAPLVEFHEKYKAHKAEIDRLEDKLLNGDLRTPQQKAKQLAQAVERSIDPKSVYDTDKLKNAYEVREIANNENVHAARKAYEEADSEYPKYAKDDKTREYYERMAANVRYKLDDFETNYPSQSVEGLEDWYVYDDGDQGSFNSFTCYLIDHGIDVKEYGARTFEAHKNYDNVREQEVKQQLGSYADKKIGDGYWQRTYADIVSDAVEDYQDSQTMFYFGWYDADWTPHEEKHLDEAKKVIEEYKKTHPLQHSDDLLDDFLAHYGVGPDDNPPGRGSGRYAKGTGERPFQHDPEMLAKKKKGLFSGIKTALAKRKANTEIDKYRDYVDGMLNGTLKNDKSLYEKYKELNERTDGKEFDRGPFRYQYNVPDELSGKETDREKLASEWKKFSEEVVDKHAKAEAENAKAEREAEKAKAIASGDPEQISKWLSEMTDQEQYNAINRIRQTQDIKNQAAAQVKAREDAARAEEQRIAQQKAAEEARRKAIEEANRPKTKQEIRKEKFENFMDTSQQVLDRAKQIRDMAEKGIDIWNTIAALNNTFNEDHEMKMIKRPEQFFKEKADKEAAKIRREQQLEDAKTKRENDLADALRKEQREDEKWRKEFINKNGVDPDDIILKNKETSESKEPESKSSEPKKEEKKSGLFDRFKKKDKSKEETEAPRQASNEPEDWYTPAQSIARKLLTSTAESRKEAAEAGNNYWKSISDWANDPSTERESNAAYNRDRANENARYNEWEANEQKNAAQRIANEERARREAAERYESESASREARLKREAQQYKFAQAAYEEKIKARDLDREHNNGDNWRHHDEQVKEAREKLDEIRKDYNLFRKYL